MPAFQDHLRVTVLIDGVRQIKATNIQVNGQSGAQAVETLDGLTGKTPGSKRVEMSITSAVPISGPEFDFATAVADGTYHEIQFPLGAKTIVAQGWFQDYSVQGSVNANTEISANFVGELKKPQ